MNKSTYMGEVTNRDDPEKRGRIKAKCPGLVRADRELPMWIDPCFPYVDSEAVGWFFVPKVGAQVEIEVTVGAPGDQTRGEASLAAHGARYRAGLYSEAQQVPSEFKENYPNRRGFKTPSGGILMFDDTDGKEAFTVKDKSGNSLLMTTNGIKIISKQGHYIEWKTSALELEATVIKIGAAASEHLVKGESLLTFLNTTLKISFDTHTHPHPMGPTGTPIVPQPSCPNSVLSTKHQVE